MNITEIMKENNINLEWLFVLAKLDNQEGLMYFETVTDEVNQTEVTNLDPKCFIIDGAKFIYEEEMDPKITIHALEGVITFTRVDGIQLNIDTSQVKGFPFRYDQFKTSLVKEPPKEGHVLVE